MSRKQYAAGKYAIGCCDICGWRYYLKDLRFEPVSAYDSPNNKKINIRACPTCWDPPHPLSFLPDAVKAKLPDAQALFQPRPQTYPSVYAVGFVQIGSIYGPIDLTKDDGLIDTGISLPQGYNALLVGVGQYLPLNLVVTPTAPLVVTNAMFASPLQVRFLLNIPSDCPVGPYPISFATAAPGGMAGTIQGLVTVIPS